MTSEGQPCVYLFRGHFSPRGDTVVCAAPLEMVVSVYGGGGINGDGGLSAVFEGSAFFRNEETGAAYLGVWGARNASHFRSALRQHFGALTIIRGPLPARLVRYSTAGGPTKRGWRALTVQERAVLDRLLRLDFPGRDALR